MLANGFALTSWTKFEPGDATSNEDEDMIQYGTQVTDTNDDNNDSNDDNVHPESYFSSDD